MTFATPITGMNAGYMAQFTPAETSIAAAALALYADASSSDMSSDRAPDLAISTARNLAQRLTSGRVRTVYTAAQIAALYDALGFFLDTWRDFPEYWEALPDDVETARAKSSAMFDAMAPAALAHAWKEGSQ